MVENLLGTLRTHRAFFGSAERKIADELLRDPRAFIQYSLAELSERANVSQGSVINFANKHAGGGFPQLKLQIAAELSEYERQSAKLGERGDSVGDILVRTVENSALAMQNTVEINNGDTLARVAKRILQAKKVEIYGVFRSAVVATDFYYQLLQLGVPASFVGDVLTCAISASMLERDCLVIAVSGSGKTKDVIDAAGIAKSNGVPVVCLTGDPTSPLAKLSDEVLVAAPGGRPDGRRETEIRLSQIALTDALCAYLRAQIEEQGEGRYFDLKSIMSSHNVND